MPRKTFLRLALRWVSRCRVAPDYCASKRNRLAVLTRLQKEAAARILGTPRRVGRCYKSYKSVQDARQHALRIPSSGVCKSAPIRTRGFRAMGGQAVPGAPQAGRPGRPRGAPPARAGESAGGRGGVARRCAVGGAGGRHGAPPDAQVVDLQALGMEQTHLWWGDAGFDRHHHFTFMLDATIKSKKDGAAKVKVIGFYAADIAWPREDVRPGKHLNTEDHIMWCLVVRPQDGLISSPEMMHWAAAARRRRRAGAAAGATGRHKPTFLTWCAPSPGGNARDALHCSLLARYTAAYTAVLEQHARVVA